MTLCDQTINQISEHFSARLMCRAPEGRYDVLSTPFFYPDRDNVELFLSEVVDGFVLISDLGQTSLKLSTYGFTPHTSARRRAMIFEIVSSLNVRYENGSLSVVTEQHRVGQRAWDLLLAIQRLSDLVFTVPGYTKATFPDEFENFIISREVQYTRGVQIELPLRGISIQPYRFTADFLIPGEEGGRDKVVQLLSAGSVGYARERVDRVYVNFAEMRLVDDSRAKLAVVDDVQDVWGNVIPILEHQADRILFWSQKTDLVSALKG